MRRVVDYDILGGYDSNQLRKALLLKLKDGWEIHGSPFYGANSAMYQAVIKWEYSLDMNPALAVAQGTTSHDMRMARHTASEVVDIERAPPPLVSMPN